MLIDHAAARLNPTKHTLVVLVENKPGVLTRVASLFRRRNFNIDSLAVGTTDDPAVSRMTIVVDTSKTSAALVERNLFKVVNVIDVQDLTGVPSIARELALIKVRVSDTVKRCASTGPLPKTPQSDFAYSMLQPFVQPLLTWGC